MKLNNLASSTAANSTNKSNTTINNNNSNMTNSSSSTTTRSSNKLTITRVMAVITSMPSTMLMANKIGANKTKIGSKKITIKIMVTIVETTLPPLPQRLPMAIMKQKISWLN